MCHLVGFIGEQPAISILIESLRIQEPIIGAQATGVALLEKNNLLMKKDAGPVAQFEKQFKMDSKSTVGIAHTRYAVKNTKYAETNTREKAHPFWNSTKTFITMHNGTITNYTDFTTELENRGYQFRSKSTFINNEQQEIVDYCDSELFSFRLEEELKQENDIKAAIRNACKKIQGQFAFVVLHPSYPNNIFIANWMQPMHIGYSKGSSFFTSFWEGFQPHEEFFPWRFTPAKNSLIILSRGKVEIEPLLVDRMIPKVDVKEELFVEVILKALKEGFRDVASIWTFIEANTEQIGLLKEDYTEIVKMGGYTFTPFIYQKLMEFVEEGIVERRLEFVWEGGIAQTPRYKFYEIAE